MRRVTLALAAGLVGIVAALGVVLSGSPITVAGSYGAAGPPRVANTSGGVTLCQNAGTLVAHTTAIRVSLSANTGPEVAVKVLLRGRVIASGSRPAGWGLAETVTVPVKPLPYSVPHVRLCTVMSASPEGFEIKGGHTAVLTVEYLRPGPSSWWSLAPSVAEHLGFGRAPTGSWIAWLLLAAMLAVTGLAARTVLQELR
jgi:hypothetical protein